MSLSEAVEFVGGDEELLSLCELLRLGVGELAGEGFVRGLEVGSFGAFLREFGIEAGGVCGACFFNLGYLLLYGVESFVIGSRCWCRSSPACCRWGQDAEQKPVALSNMYRNMGLMIM